VSQTHSLAEWAAVLSLGIGVHAAFSVPYFLLVDAHRSDFPRLWQAAVHARHDVDRALAAVLLLIADAALYVRLTARETALTAAALLALLTIRPEALR
jgi:prophage DNA circulation protein